MGCGMDRRQKILEHIRPGMRGIEIGPFFAPLLPKADGWDVQVLDVYDADQLRERAAADPGIAPAAIARIETVDLLGPAHRLAELAGAAGHAPHSFDFVLSSHNFEHLPDPLRFLQAVQQVLKPGGVLSMVLPDKRFCFDMLRPRSTLGEVLEAYFERREQPTLRQHFDMVVDFVTLAPAAPEEPSADDPLRSGTPHEILQEAFGGWVRALKAASRPYSDVHCWTFTPTSAELLLRDLRFLDLIDLDIASCSDTEGYDFLVHLRNAPDAAPMMRADHYRLRRQLFARLAAEQDAFGESTAAGGPSGRLTAPGSPASLAGHPTRRG